MGTQQRRRPTMAERADRHALYERAVQNVEAEIDFVEREFRRLRGRRARWLREDFCGTAGAACEWVRRRRDHHAVGVDLDAEVLDWGRRHNLQRLGGTARRMTLLRGDVRSVSTPGVDLLLAMNFSYWVFRSRETLCAYLAHARAQLATDGVMFLDAYGGYDAHRLLTERTDHGEFTYVWDQAALNPVTNDMTCHIHFRFADGSRLERAFTYCWRLWSLPELRELLAEAGFARSLVYWEGTDPDTGEGNGEYTPTELGEPDAGWVCYLAALT